MPLGCAAPLPHKHGTGSWGAMHGTVPPCTGHADVPQRQALLGFAGPGAYVEVEHFGRLRHPVGIREEFRILVGTLDDRVYADPGCMRLADKNICVPASVIWRVAASRNYVVDKGCNPETKCRSCGADRSGVSLCYTGLDLPPVLDPDCNCCPCLPPN